MTHSTNNINGLTDEQVELRKREGKANNYKIKNRMSYAKIFKKNFLSPFFIYNLAIFIFLVLVGAYKNSLFFVVILFNFSLSFFQEIRTKKILDKLDICIKQKVRLLRNNGIGLYNSEEIVLDDIICYGCDEQVIVDSKIITGSVEVDESYLTGEAEIIYKREGEMLISGSIIITGECKCLVTRVGKDTKLYQLEKKAKEDRKNFSDISISMKRIISVTMSIIPLIFIFLLIQGQYRGEVFQETVVSSSSAVLGMLPKGLIFITSIYLVIGVYNLAKCRVLVKQLCSLESIAYCNTIFFDKTGTLTTGEMYVEDIIYVDISYKHKLKSLMAKFLYFSNEKNFTTKALINYFGKIKNECKSNIEFNSQRKFCCVDFGDNRNYILSAPEVIKDFDKISKIKQLCSRGLRILLFSTSKNKISRETREIEANVIAILIIKDELRCDIQDTVDYLYKQNFNIKVLSGDNKLSVMNIAEQCKIKVVNKKIFNDCNRLDINKNIFYRLTPEDKYTVVTQTQATGNKVMMIGDGANDIMAFNEATTSISIGTGSNVLNQISDLVILDGNFSKLKTIINNSRNIVNCIHTLGPVFFVKTIYSSILALVCIVLNMSFPFMPLQIMLIDIFIEGYPSFLLIFNKNISPIKGDFLNNTFYKAIPNALIFSLFISVILILFKCEFINKNEFGFICLSLLIVTSFLTLYQTLTPLNTYKKFILTSSFLLIIISNYYLYKFY